MTEDTCRITRGLDGWRQCVVHRWEGHAEEVKRCCPAALATDEPGLDETLFRKAWASTSYVRLVAVDNGHDEIPLLLAEYARLSGRKP